MKRTFLLLAALVALAFSSLKAQTQSFQRLSYPAIVNGAALQYPFAGGLNAPQFSPVDLNNDGRLDLVVFDRAGNTILTFLNNGAANTSDYAFAPEYACNFPALNDWARANFERLAADGILTYVVTGMGKGREGAVELRTADGAPVRAVFTAFSDRMAELMSAADLAVSRAGAGTLAELARCGTPALLVPYPQAADDHQRANAEYFAREGGGALVPQTRLADLYAKVRDTIADGDRLRRYRDNLHRMDRADPLGLMLDDLEEIARAAAARRKPERRAEEAATS